MGDSLQEMIEMLSISLFDERPSMKNSMFDWCQTYLRNIPMKHTPKHTSKLCGMFHKTCPTYPEPRTLEGYPDEHAELGYLSF